MPLRLCTLKAMLGDINSSSDSCSDSFFLSLSMTLLPLFALCRKREQSHLFIWNPCHLLLQSISPPFPLRLLEHRIPSVCSAHSRPFVSCRWWPLEGVNSLSLGLSSSANWGCAHQALPERMRPSHKSRGEALSLLKPGQGSGVTGT